jgi:dihydropteroate synthase
MVLGILNATPDSFSDGGRYASVDAGLARAEEIFQEGGDIVDIGGESTRPGAASVGLDEELARVVPIAREIARRWPEAVISVDTTKAEVASAALDEGAHVVNDVSAFRIDPRMREICASRKAGVVMMHSRGPVAEMASYRYANYGDDTMGEVLAELSASVEQAMAAGIRKEAVALDPGIGFSKTSEHSLAALRTLGRLVDLGYPVMVGASRKRFIGELTRVQKAADRVHGSVGAHVAAFMAGARLFRVHDVAAHRQALDVAAAIKGG